MRRRRAAVLGLSLSVGLSVTVGPMLSAEVPAAAATSLVGFMPAVGAGIQTAALAEPTVGPTAPPEVTTTMATGIGQTKSVIPRPNSGSAPQQTGDRGGAGQLALLALLVLAITAVGAIVVRSTMRTTRSRSTKP